MTTYYQRINQEARDRFAADLFNNECDITHERYIPDVRADYLVELLMEEQGFRKSVLANSRHRNLRKDRAARLNAEAESSNPTGCSVEYAMEEYEWSVAYDACTRDIEDALRSLQYRWRDLAISWLMEMEHADDEAREELAALYRQGPKAISEGIRKFGCRGHGRHYRFQEERRCYAL